MNKSGTTGEKYAELLFRSMGWVMERHQPATRVIPIKGKPVAIPCKSTGVPDYTGYELCQVHEYQLPLYRACEVKEAYGDTLPCSRLGESAPPLDARKGASQNWWFSQIDQQCAFVCVVWMSGELDAELFKWKPSGSYKRGEGLK
jgi:hypothetical protein